MLRAMFAALMLLAFPAAAQTVHIVTGADPTPSYEVREGDTLVLRKAMGREMKTDGSRDRAFGAWIDRANGRGWNMVGASKLALVGHEAGKGYVYRPMNAAPRPTSTRFGVNLSGCEFAASTALCPTPADIDAYAAKGFTLIRLPVQDLHLRGDNLPKIAALVAYAQGKGLQVILDRHDYKRHSGADAWAFWRGVLPSFSPDTLIELANEPVKEYPAGSNVWMVSAQDTKDTVALFRANGITNPILYGSPGYSATFRFVKFKSAKAPAEGMGDAVDRVGGIGDPLNKTFFSGHLYLDKGSSGTNATCTATGDAGIAAWAESMRKRGIKGYLTEFAFGRHSGIPASCAAVGDAMMAAVKANSDVILGTTAWGGGRAWPEGYAFKVESVKGTFKTSTGSPYLTKLMGR